MAYRLPPSFWTSFEQLRRPGRIAVLCHWTAFALLSAVVILSPWLYASWEMWWFWSMCVLLAGACFFSGAGTMLESALPHESDFYGRRTRVPLRAFVAMGVCAPILLYAALRLGLRGGDGLPLVWMDAERSFLLFLTPVLIGFTLLFSASPYQRRWLVKAILANTVLLCVYGIVNHYLTDDMVILWSKVNSFHYQGRLSASFFCPNNFAAYMNIAFAILVGAMLMPKTKWWVRILCALVAALFFFTDYLTLSRGGIASLFVALLVAVPTFALRGRPLFHRLALSVFALVVVVGAVVAIRYTDNPLMNRMTGGATGYPHPIWAVWEDSNSFEEFWPRFQSTFERSFDRGQYIGAALRSWHSAPVLGIGPGQHQHHWGEFRASEDGVRPTPEHPTEYKFPSIRNTGFYLYDVHSDWTQLLEEYGIVGLVLMIVAVIGMFTLLALRHGVVAQAHADVPDAISRGLPLAAELAMLALIVHSFFDFSLQIPATLWTLAVLIVAALLETGTEEGR